jgi:DNA-binding transcriptional MerR regulator
MELNNGAHQEMLDIEWVSLIMDARAMGLSVEEIRIILSELQVARSFEGQMKEQ